MFNTGFFNSTLTVFLFLFLTRGERRFEKPGRKDPGWCHNQVIFTCPSWNVKCTGLFTCCCLPQWKFPQDIFRWITVSELPSLIIKPWYQVVDKNKLFFRKAVNWVGFSLVNHPSTLCSPKQLWGCCPRPPEEARFHALRERELAFFSEWWGWWEWRGGGQCHWDSNWWAQGFPIQWWTGTSLLALNA